MEVKAAHTVSPVMRTEPLVPGISNAARREKSLDKIEAQLDAWSTQLDTLVLACLEAGAHAHDPYRMGIETLRVRYAAVRASLVAFQDPSHDGGTYNDFRAAIADDWNALDAGFKALIRE